MEILDKIRWNFEQGKYDTSTLTGTLTTEFTINISNEQYYRANRDRQNSIFEKCKKQIKSSISNVIFSEVIDMLRVEGNAMIRDSFKCSDYRDSEQLRECARKLLLMASKMECPE